MPTETSRKRQRTAAAQGAGKEDEGKKQRGRPRVEGQDETAADRRRTQIRLAQRAYRLRKETTITSLKTQVSSLHSTIDAMTKTFLEFNDRAVASGILSLRPELARDLKTATESFILLAKQSAQNDEDGSASEDGEPEPVVPKQSRAAQRTQSTSQSATQSTSQRSSSPSPPLPAPQPQTRDIGLGYVQIMEPVSPQPRHAKASMDDAVHTASYAQTSGYSYDVPMDVPMLDYPVYPSTASGGSGTISAGLVVPMAHFPQHVGFTVPSPKVLAPAAPYTYSFQEISFARRLQRAALERGFHLLSTSDLRPQTFAQVFRLSLLYHTRETLLAKFRSLLTRSTNDPLEVLNTPFIHLGGAGLHYAKGRVHNGYTVAPGPVITRARLESTDQEGVAVDIDLDLAEYAGQWFDANDVEGYLEERGVVLDPQALFADATVGYDFAEQLREYMHSPVEPIGQTASERSASALSGSPLLSTEAMDTTTELSVARLFPELADLERRSAAEVDQSAAAWLLGSGERTPDFLGSGWMYIQPAAGWDMRDEVGGDGGSARSGSMSGGESRGRRSQRSDMRKITIDVSRFIDELIRSAICLGRAPGFRKGNVDRALASAVLQVY
ncbi:hypothetical protein EJ06DRAFT_580960 [Trichodelitschia bisporula]|uniref:BZIP domain-containing protein n=1 Tax=Trichodelitschia bisporula TaxID=703511 RepID=A0A6G1I0K6_9PEZI|nr:hypothetical protein EJ06DRAFT_580960 [Trichodelitschia bisporula]